LNSHRAGSEIVILLFAYNTMDRATLEEIEALEKVK